MADANHSAIPDRAWDSENGCWVNFADLQEDVAKAVRTAQLLFNDAEWRDRLIALVKHYADAGNTDGC